jgi:hypothetical protein
MMRKAFSPTSHTTVSSSRDARHPIEEPVYNERNATRKVRAPVEPRRVRFARYLSKLQELNASGSGTTRQTRGLSTCPDSIYDALSTAIHKDSMTDVYTILEAGIFVRDPQILQAIEEDCSREVMELLLCRYSSVIAWKDKGIMMLYVLSYTFSILSHVLYDLLYVYTI